MSADQQRKARALFRSVSCDQSIAQLLRVDLRDVMQLRQECGQ